ncbi:MAG: hypothetical protein MHMPM18_004955 [Marteilia pararefringens]
MFRNALEQLQQELLTPLKTAYERILVSSEQSLIFHKKSLVHLDRTEQIQNKL